MPASRPIFIPPGGGDRIDFLAVTHKLTGAETGGALCMFESVFGPGEGNRLHRHRREDEIGYVLEGALEVRLQGETRVLEAGGVAHLPRNLAHALRNPLEQRSRYLFVATPAGLDAWFDALARANRDETLDDEAYSALARDFELEWLE